MEPPHSPPPTSIWGGVSIQSCSIWGGGFPLQPSPTFPYGVGAPIQPSSIWGGALLAAPPPFNPAPYKWGGDLSADPPPPTHPYGEGDVTPFYTALYGRGGPFPTPLALPIWGGVPTFSYESDPRSPLLFTGGGELPYIPPPNY